MYLLRYYDICRQVSEMTGLNKVTGMFSEKAAERDTGKLVVIHFDVTCADREVLPEGVQH